MSEIPKGSPAGNISSDLDEKYQELLELAKEEYDIDIIQTISGGYSGALLYLANVRRKDDPSSKLVVLKLDHYDKNKNENDQHETVLNAFSDRFRHDHLVEMAFPAVTLTKKGVLHYFTKLPAIH